MVNTVEGFVAGIVPVIICPHVSFVLRFLFRKPEEFYQLLLLILTFVSLVIWP